MDSQAQDSERDAVLRSAQIVAGALIGGVPIFLAVALFLRSGGEEPIFVWKDLGDGSSILTVVGIVGAVLGAVASFLVPPLFVANQRRALAAGRFPPPPQGGVAPTTETGALASIYLTQTIVALAVPESMAFLNLIAFFLVGHPVSLVVAGVLVALMATRFPTRGGLDSWIEQQRRWLHDERGTA